MYLILTRISDDGLQTVGKLELFDQSGNLLLAFDTLELPYKYNQRRVSCINQGVYIIRRHYSIRHGNCFALLNVQGRDNILIHTGNFNKDTKGCILIGHGYKDLDNDNEKDLLNSKVALNNLLRTMVPQTTITIINQWEQLNVIL